MTEKLVRLCDICGEIVAIHSLQDSQYWNLRSDYWRSKDMETIICAKCGYPLLKAQNSMGAKALAEFCAWLSSIKTDDDFDFLPDNMTKHRRPKIAYHMPESVAEKALVSKNKEDK